MAEQKIIFFDLDGTLVPIGGEFPKSTGEALKKAQANGHKIFINTGRSRNQIYDFLLNFGFDGIVSGTGCYVEVADKPIFFKPFSEEAYQETIQILDAYKVSRLVQSRGALLTQPSHLKAMVYGFGHLPKEEVTQEIALDFMKAFGDVKMGSFETFTQKYGPVENICFADAPISYKDLDSKLPDELRVVASSIDGTLCNAGEIVKRDFTKGTALEIVADYFNCDIKDTIAFGDGDNDIDMIKEAGTGIAMQNGSPHAKQSADFITSACDDNGIANALKKLDII